MQQGFLALYTNSVFEAKDLSPFTLLQTLQPYIAHLYEISQPICPCLGRYAVDETSS